MVTQGIGQFEIHPDFFDEGYSYHRELPYYYYTKFEKLAEKLLETCEAFSGENQEDKNRAVNISRFVRVLHRKLSLLERFHKKGPSEVDKAIMLLALGLINSSSQVLKERILENIITIYPPKPITRKYCFPARIEGKVFNADLPLRCTLTFSLPTWTERDNAATYILCMDLKKSGLTGVNTQALESLIARNPEHQKFQGPHTLRCIWSKRKDSLFANLPLEIAEIIITLVSKHLRNTFVQEIHDAAKPAEPPSRP